MKGDDKDQTSCDLLPDFELIIAESKKINITDDKIVLIMNQLGLSGFKEQIPFHLPEPIQVESPI